MTGAAAILTGFGLGNLTLLFEGFDQKETGKNPKTSTDSFSKLPSKNQTNFSDKNQGFWPWSRPTPQVPFIADVPEADLKLRLVPRSFETTLPWYIPDTQVKIEEGGEITSHLKVRDNRLLSIYQSILNFHGISFENLFFYGELDRLMLGTQGGLHAIIKTSPKFYEEYTDQVSLELPSNYYLGTDANLLLNLIREKTSIRFPFMSEFWESFPLGIDQPYVCEADSPPIDENLLEYPSEDNPKLDFDLTKFLPSSLTKADGYFGTNPELNNLVQRAYRIVDWQANKSLIKRFLKYLSATDNEALSAWAKETLIALSHYKSEAKWKKSIKLTETETHPEEILDFFKEGEVELEMGELADFYWPGLLDLGRSSGVFRLGFKETEAKQGGSGRYKLHKVWYAEAEALDLNFESIASLPFIKDLKVQSGADYTLPSEQKIPGGVHLEFDPGEKQIDASANLKITAQLELPFLGKTEINFDLIFKTQLRPPATPAESEEDQAVWAMVPKQNSLLLDNLSIDPGNPEMDLHPNLTLDINDRTLETEGFNVSVKGNLGDSNSTQLDWKATLPIPQEDGFYNWENFQLKNSLELNNAEGGKVAVDATLSSPGLITRLAEKNFSWLGVRLVIDQVAYDDGDPKKQQDFTLQDGLIVFLQKKRNNGTTWEASFRTDALEYGKEAFRDAQGKVKIKQHPRADGRIECTAALGLHAISQQQKDSQLKGPIKIALAPCDDDKTCRFPESERPQWELKPLVEQGARFLWDPNTKIFTTEGVNVTYQVWGLPLTTKLKTQQRVARRERRLDGERLGSVITGTMAQGAFTGFYTFDFENFKGHGNAGFKENYGSFHDKDFNLRGAPPYKNTHLICTELDKFYLDKGYALGKCEIKPEYDGQGLSEFGININAQGEAELDYIQFPYKIKEGLKSITSDYYHELFQNLILNPDLPNENQEASSPAGLAPEEGQP